MHLIRHIIHKHWKTAFFLLFFILVGTNLHSIASDSPGSDGFYAGETLNPSCTPGSANCSVSSVWTASGTSAYYSAGNVGIGTTTPTKLLDVNGTSIFRGSTTFQDINPELITTTTNGYVATSYDSTSSGGGAQNVFRRANGTEATPTAITNGMTLGSFSFRGHTGSAFTGSKGYFEVTATENWSPSANGTDMTWAITPNGSTTLDYAMTLSQAGYLGIGTRTPEAKLHVSGADATIGAFVENTSSTSARYPLTYIANYAGATTGHPLTVMANARGTKASPTASQSGDSFGMYVFKGYDGAAFIDGARIAAFAPATWSVGSTPTDLRFYTTDTSGTYAERMRIMENGNLGIGTTAPSTKLHVVGSGATATTPAVRIENLPTSAPSGTNEGIVCVDDAGALWNDSDGTEDCM